MYKIVMMGDGAVGKTALTIQLCLNHFVEQYDPTIEDSYRKQIDINGRAYSIEILDTAGQEEYVALLDQWIRDGEGFVLVYSTTSRDSFESISRYHENIMRVKEVEDDNEEREKVPTVLVGNKIDRFNEREVSYEEGKAYAQELGCPFVETSAKTAQNVAEAFRKVLLQVLGPAAELATQSGQGRSKKFKKCLML